MRHIVVINHGEMRDWYLICSVLNMHLWSFVFSINSSSHMTKFSCFTYVSVMRQPRKQDFDPSLVLPAEIFESLWSSSKSSISFMLSHQISS